jgi:hypothetical protein
VSQPICATCGCYEDEHHAFSPLVGPPGCVCDLRTWSNPQTIKAICNEFVGNYDGEYCQTCEHDKGCHQ